MSTNYTNKRIWMAVEVLTLGIFVSYTLIANAQASLQNINYPIAELGHCASEDECKSYCDEPANYTACFKFAKNNGLLTGPLAGKSEVEIERFAVVMQAGGPGGCRNQKECETYCSNVDRLDECLSFAESNGVLSDTELDEIRKVKRARDQGVQFPGGCKSKEQCEEYCSQEGNIDECLSFAEKAGFIPPDELEQAKKAMEFIRRGETPGGCKSKASCETYCENPDHLEECIDFGIKSGFMSPEEAELIKKTGGKGPGGCRGRKECEQFCEQDNNFEACTQFAIEHNLVSPGEAEIIRKTGGKGPGGCRGKAECEAFCQNPANQESCFSFAKEHGLISEEDLGRIQQQGGQFLQVLEQAPPEVVDCLRNAIGAEQLDKLRSGAGFPPPGIAEKMQACFTEQFGGGEGFGPPGHEGPPPGEFPQSRDEFREDFRGNERIEVDRFEAHIPPPGAIPSPEQLQEFQKFQQPSFIPAPEDLQKLQEFQQFIPSDLQQQFQQQSTEQLPPPTDFQQQYQQQLEDQFRQQYEQQYQEQYQEFSPELHQEAPPPPSSQAPKGTFLGNLFRAARNLLR